MSVDNKYWNLRGRYPIPIRENDRQYRNIFKGQRTSHSKLQYHKHNVQKTDKKKHIPKMKYDDDIKFSETYNIMLTDERIYPVMRVYKPEAKYLDEAINVYKFYFNELKHNLNQRTQTLHLAFAYFTQTIMRCPCLQK